MKKIKKVELVLENCEAIGFDNEHVSYFNVSNISRSLYKAYYNDTATESFRSEGLFLHVSQDANNHESFIDTWHEGEVTPFERFQQYRDIVAVNIVYLDGTEEYIYAPWGGNSDYANTFQTVAIHPETGDLYIAVSEKENVQSCFKYDLYKEKY